jgi:dolichyl-phosphate-mannose--protein O-mannosyl transferase
MLGSSPFRAEIDRIDVFLIFFLMIFSLWTRFWLLGYPNAVIFDEIHFGSFTNWYVKSEFFYDIHPPLGKLVMFLFAKLAEYDGSLDFKRGIGREYATEDYIALRITPAFFSALCVPLLYLSLRFDSFSSASAFVSSFLAACDSSLLAEHRYILSDAMLHFFTVVFVAFYAHSRNVAKSMLSLVVSGLLLGCACSCKNTAWGLMAFCGFVELADALRTFSLLQCRLYMSLLARGLCLALPLAATYVGCFCLHFIVLPYNGQGAAYLSPEMQEQLLPNNNGSLWYARLSGVGLLRRTIALSINMHQGNMGITQYHPYQSRPVNWPLLTGIAVGFWAGPGVEVACVGNAIVYALAIAGLGACLAAGRAPKWRSALKYVVGWAVCYFPFFLIPRSMYLYHYLIPLLFGCMAAGAAIDLWLPRFWAGFAAMIICLAAFTGFLLWAPFAFGTKHFADDYVIWTENWRRGDQYHRNRPRH